MSWWVLVLYFTHRVGSAEPATRPGGFYATQQECMEAGNMWVKPNANPSSFACNYVGPKYRLRREGDQE
jgi:hypothetical protein